MLKLGLLGIISGFIVLKNYMFLLCTALKSVVIVFHPQESGKEEDEDVCSAALCYEKNKVRYFLLLFLFNLQMPFISTRKYM